MACLITKDGKLAVCGVPRRRDYFFDKKRRAIWCQNSLWYEPTLVAKRKRFERIDLFVKRFQKKRKFRPLTHDVWWKTVALPEIEATMKYEREWKEKNGKS